MRGNYRPLPRSSAPIDDVLSGSRSMETGKVMLSLRVDSDLKSRFKASCAAHGMTMEQAADEALRTWLATGSE